MDPDSLRVDRTVLRVDGLHDEPDERAHWRSKTPEKRILAVELMRQILYGYDPATARLQRILEVVEVKPR